MNYYVIFLGIFVILLLYILYINYVSKSDNLTTLVDLNKSSNMSIPYTDLVKRDSTRYSYAVWVYVNSWSSTFDKPLLTRGTEFNLSLDRTTPTLRCNLASSGTTANSDIIITHNFPIQKWSYVIISVDNQIVDIYLDGKLVLSTKLNNIPIVPTTDIKLGDSTKPNDIFLANLIRLPTPMDPQTAWSNYLKGNGMSNTSNLNIKLSVLQDNIQQKEFTLF